MKRSSSKVNVTATTTTATPTTTGPKRTREAVAETWEVSRDTRSLRQTKLLPSAADQIEQNKPMLS